MYYVYLLKSESFFDKTYIGYTKNLKIRLKKHNAGGSIYTAKYKPWKLNAYFAFEKESTAIRFEKYLKSNSGRAFANKHFWTKEIHIAKNEYRI